MAFRKYFKDMREAKKAFKDRFGVDFGSGSWAGANTLFKLKHGRNKGKIFMGTYLEWLNLP